MVNTEIRLITFFVVKDGEALYSQQTLLGPNCGSDHKLLTAKFRLKRVGKTIRPFRYGLTQIPDDYTVEVTNRLKGLDLVGRVSEELWTKVHNIVQGAVTKISMALKALPNIQNFTCFFLYLKDI